MLAIGQSGRSAMRPVVSILCTVLLLASCTTVRPTAAFFAPALVVQCVDASELNRSYRAIYGLKAPEVAGYYLPALRLLCVRWSGELDKNGEPIPDLESLGHEYWHSIKNDFHRGTHDPSAPPPRATGRPRASLTAPRPPP